MENVTREKRRESKDQGWKRKNKFCVKTRKVKKGLAGEIENKMKRKPCPKEVFIEDRTEGEQV